MPPIWSTTTETDDTLTISPTAGWTIAANHTLTIDADDLVGNSLATLNLNYEVYNGTILFVSATAADDNGDGLSPATAKLTIPAAIAVAPVPAAVVVNADTFNVDSGAATHVVLVEGVSLYGGHNADFSARDPVNYVSTLTDTSTLATNTFSLPSTAIEAAAGITEATVVEGFTVNGSSQSGADYTASFWSYDGSSPLLRGNILNGGSGDVFSMSMLNDNAPPLIQGNTINGGGGSGGISYAVFNDLGASPLIRSNIIDGGNGATSSLAISNSNAATAPLIQNNSIYGGNGGLYSFGIRNTNRTEATVQNNIIHGGSGRLSFGIGDEMLAVTVVQNNTINGGSGDSRSYGISISDSAPLIENNIVFTSVTGSGLAYCIFELSANSNADSIRNNNLFDCGTSVYGDFDAACTGNADGDADDTTCTLTEMQALLDFGAGGVSGNIETDPVFVDVDGVDNDIDTTEDNDWHLSGTSPVSITTGGLNGIDEGFGFSDDKDGIP